MNNNFFRFFHFAIIASLVALFVVMNKKPEALSGHADGTRQPPKRFPAAIQKRQAPPQLRNFKKPVLRKPTTSHSFSKMVIADTDVKLSGSMVLAENIGAMPLSSWTIGMKPFLSQSGAYGFYEKSPGAPSIPVAYNPTTDQFHVISSILQVRGTDQALRENLLNRGLEEYLYVPNVKILFVKSPQNDVVALYQELQKEGHKVSLEVFKDRPRSR